MHTPTDVMAGVGLRARSGKSRWPARMDLAQSLSGLALGLFMWGHMFFVSSILLGYDAMWVVTKAFEGYFFFGRAYPLIVSAVVAVVAVLFVLPWLISLVVFTAYPVIASFYFSFTKYDVLNPPQWIGADNFTVMFTKDPLFWKAVWNTTYYSLLTVPLQLGIALLLAITTGWERV